MKIIYHRNFTKTFLKLTIKQQNRIIEAITDFQNNPFDPILKNHALHGDQKNRRAFSVGGDLRIVYEEENNYTVVTFYRVGTHNQVY